MAEKVEWCCVYKCLQGRDERMDLKGFRAMTSGYKEAQAVETGGAHEVRGQSRNGITLGSCYCSVIIPPTGVYGYRFKL